MPQVEAVKPGPVHENGWRRESVWEDDNGMAPDCLAAWTAFYVKPGTRWEASLTYYVEQIDVHPDDPRNGKYGVEVASQVYQRRDDGDQDDLDTEYDYGTVLVYETVDEAARDAERKAMQDESYVFCA